LLFLFTVPSVFLLLLKCEFDHKMRRRAEIYVTVRLETALYVKRKREP